MLPKNSIVYGKPKDLLRLLVITVLVFAPASQMLVPSKTLSEMTGMDNIIKQDNENQNTLANGKWLFYESKGDLTRRMPNKHVRIEYHPMNPVLLKKADENKYIYLEANKCVLVFDLQRQKVYVDTPFVQADPNLDPQPLVLDFASQDSKNQQLLTRLEGIIDDTGGYEGFNVLPMIEFAKPIGKLEDVMKIGTLIEGSLDIEIELEKDPFSVMMGKLAIAAYYQDPQYLYEISKYHPARAVMYNLLKVPVQNLIAGQFNDHRNDAIAKPVKDSMEKVLNNLTSIARSIIEKLLEEDPSIFFDTYFYHFDDNSTLESLGEDNLAIYYEDDADYELGLFQTDKLDKASSRFLLRTGFASVLKGGETYQGEYDTEMKAIREEMPIMFKLVQDFMAKVPNVLGTRGPIGLLESHSDEILDEPCKEIADEVFKKFTDENVVYDPPQSYDLVTLLSKTNVDQFVAHFLDSTIINWVYDAFIGDLGETLDNDDILEPLGFKELFEKETLDEFYKTLRFIGLVEYNPEMPVYMTNDTVQIRMMGENQEHLDMEIAIDRRILI